MGTPTGGKTYFAFLRDQAAISPRRRRVWLHRGLARFVSIIAFGTFVIYANPLNLVATTNLQTARILNHFLSLFLPDRWRDDVAVVLIDDHYVNNHSSWPMSYVEHARNLSRILAFEPRAVFVDMLFARNKTAAGILPLVLTLKEYRRRGIKVFVPEADTRAGMLEQIRRLVTPVSTYLPQSVEPDQEYPLRRNISAAPALALLDAVCADGGGESAADVCARWPGAANPAFRTSNMLLVWGTSYSEGNERQFRCPSSSRQTWFDWVQYLGAMEWFIPLKGCPRHPTLLIENLMGGFTDAQIRPYLAGHFVIYAPGIEGVSSMVSTPTSFPVSISFSYTHAVALENLLAFGDGFFTKDKDVHGLSLVALLNYVLFVACALMSALTSLNLDRFAAIHKGRKSVGAVIDISAILMMVVFLFLISAFFVLTFRVAPANFVGIATLVTTLREARDWRYYRSLETGILRIIRRGRRLASA